MLSTSKCVARPVMGMLIELTVRESMVALPTIVAWGAASPEQRRSEWTVACVASIVRRGVLFIRIINSSWLGNETSVA